MQAIKNIDRSTYSCNAQLRIIPSSRMSQSLHQVPLIDKVQVLSQSYSGMSNDLIAEKINQNISCVLQIVSEKNRITKCTSPKATRRFLTLKDRLRVICPEECGEFRSSICNEFETSPNTYHRIIKGKLKWKTQATRGCPLTIRRACNARHQGVDDELLNFIMFARSLRLRVTRGSLQERAEITATSLGLPQFTASNGYIERF